MAVGDAGNIHGRLRKYLPPSWFGGRGDSPLVGSVMAGVAAILVNTFSLIAFAKLQARIATSTGGWLDLSAYSFLGSTLPRFHLEIDDSYRPRVMKEIFRERNTRPSGIDLLTELTGQVPFVYEGWYAPANGGWRTPAFAWGSRGRLGSRGQPSRVIFETTIPQTYGVPNRGGWGSTYTNGGAVGGWGIGNFSWVDYDESVGHGAALEDILSRLDAIRTDGVEYWVRFSNPPGF